MKDNAVLTGPYSGINGGNRAGTAPVELIVMRDLTNLLWCDLTDDQERIAFLESGRAWNPGIISMEMVPVIVQTIRARIALRDAHALNSNGLVAAPERLDNWLRIIEA